MSEIINAGLDQYGAEPFKQQQFGPAGRITNDSHNYLTASGSNLKLVSWTPSLHLICRCCSMNLSHSTLITITWLMSSLIDQLGQYQWGTIRVRDMSWQMMHSKPTTDHDRALVASEDSRRPWMCQHQTVQTLTCLSVTNTASPAQWYQPHPLHTHTHTYIMFHVL